jgi:hypothetical protein
VDRSRGTMHKNRVVGEVERSERAPFREAPMTKARRCRPGVRAVKDSVLTWGDLASRLKGRRRTTEREVSRGRSSGRGAEQGDPRPSEVSDGAKGRTKRRAKRP